MSLQGFYTTKGLALAAKIAAGAKLTVTKVTAGSGTTAASAAVLAGTKQTLTAGEATVSGQTAVLPVTLAEAKASASYTLTELGVYASDPDAGEILYQVFRLDEARVVAAGGENSYRFYLREAVGAAGVTVSCSPAGLLVEEDLAPVRSKVMATAMSTVRVTLSPAELPGYIAALPRLLDKYYEIKLTAGTCTETLKFNGFYGLGYLMVIGADNLGSVFTGGVSVERTRVPVRLRGLSVSGLIGDTTVSALTSAYLYMDNCTVDCTGAAYGITLYDSASASFNQCTIQNCSAGKVLICAYGSIGTFTSCTMTNNKIGAWVYHGGVVLLAGDTPDTMGGSANEKGGGLIVKENGTLL